MLQMQLGVISTRGPAIKAQVFSLQYCDRPATLGHYSEVENGSHCSWQEAVDCNPQGVHPTLLNSPHRPSGTVFLNLYSATHPPPPHPSPIPSVTAQVERIKIQKLSQLKLLISSSLVCRIPTRDMLIGVTILRQAQNHSFQTGIL